MKAISALRQAFSLKSEQAVGKKFPPEVLKRIIDAMKEYAEYKCKEQREICQQEFDSAYLENSDAWPSCPEVGVLYTTNKLLESETPDLD